VFALSKHENLTGHAFPYIQANCRTSTDLKDPLGCTELPLDICFANVDGILTPVQSDWGPGQFSKSCTWCDNPHSSNWWLKCNCTDYKGEDKYSELDLSKNHSFVSLSTLPTDLWISLQGNTSTCMRTS